MSQTIRVSLLCLALLTLAAPAALAQLSAGGGPGGAGGPGGPGGAGAAGAQGKKADAPEPPPPAIPGAESSPDLVVPPSKPAAEMNPNDALFDSISRGDLVAARDAVNRGADLNAHNVLGQTPLDSSIDLNRSDITFLLLSLRPSLNTPGGSENGQAEQETTRPVRQAKVKPARVKAPVRTVSVQRSSDGGTPDPAAGFLGFNR